MPNLNLPPNIRKNISKTSDVHSVTLINYIPSCSTWENQYLDFCVNHFFAFSFNNISLYMTWLSFCTILTFISVVSYCDFPDLVFIKYYIELSMYLELIQFHCYMLLCKYIIYLFNLISEGIWVVSSFLLFQTLLPWEWLNSCLWICMCSIIVSPVFMPSSRSVGL